jgi:hypothetical protein
MRGSGRRAASNAPAPGALPQSPRRAQERGVPEHADVESSQRKRDSDGSGAHRSMSAPCLTNAWRRRVAAGTTRVVQIRQRWQHVSAGTGGNVGDAAHGP